MFEERKKGKFLSFIKKNGAMLALAGCVLAAGGLAWLATAPEVELPVQDVQKQQSPSLQEQLEERPKATALPTPSPTAAPTPTPQVSKPQGSAGGKTTLKMVMPLDGEITRAFSGDALIYNGTLNTWMTHNGIDISAAKGADVVAALPGTVESVKDDPTRGKVVTVAHSDGRKTVYAGLEETGVKEGDKVNASSPIGRAGIPAFEAAEGPHLHFEVLRDGKYLDPAEQLE